MGHQRTALLAWLFARSTGRDFLVRVEDIDRVRPGSAERQLDDLRALGLDWDGEALLQSTRSDVHVAAIQRLTEAGLTYECFCTRREIAEAASAPHAAPGAYPGTCRHLTDDERALRRRERPAAVRLRAGVTRWSVQDVLHGRYEGLVDDFVLRRNDGVPAYNLAVVVDDADQGIDQVVRGDDLLSSSPRQAYLADLLGLPIPVYAHVPLALNTDGRRLAKRDGAVTRRELEDLGVDVLAMIAGSLGLSGASPAQMLPGFDPAWLPREPWVVVPPDPAS